MMKSGVPWVVPQCSSERPRRFGGSYDLRQVAILAWFVLRSWKWRKYVLLKRRDLSEVHGIKGQEAALCTVDVLLLRRIKIWLTQPWTGDLEYRKMDEVQRPSDSECCTPSPEPSRIPPIMQFYWRQQWAGSCKPRMLWGPRFPC
jgi:hypothetical protein